MVVFKNPYSSHFCCDLLSYQLDWKAGASFLAEAPTRVSSCPGAAAAAPAAGAAAPGFYSTSWCCPRLPAPPLAANKGKAPSYGVLYIV